MVFNHKLEQFHQHPFGAPGKSRAALGAFGHCVARRVHPGRKGRVFRKFGDLTALKFAEIHLPQIAQRNLPHAGEQDVRRFGRAQQRRGENQFDRRIGEIPLERGELGAAFVAQRQVGAGADIPAFEVAGRQAVADQVKFEVDQSMPLPERIRIFKRLQFYDNSAAARGAAVLGHNICTPRIYQRPTSCFGTLHGTKKCVHYVETARKRSLQIVFFADIINSA